MPHTYDYPRMAVTADAVVFTRTEPPKVLLIRRGKPPFEGQWAIPGGFVDMDEPIAEAAARELQEETGLSGVRLQALGYFDAVERDPRGRTLSLAFWGTIPDADGAQAMGADDAAEAAWHAIDALPPLAFDHADIVRAALDAWIGRGG